jgi:hypothetical protein
LHPPVVSLRALLDFVVRQPGVPRPTASAAPVRAYMDTIIAASTLQDDV